MGGSRTRASPSMPISTGWPDWSSKLPSAHSTQPGGRQLRPAAADSTKRASSLEERKVAATMPRLPPSMLRRDPNPSPLPNS